MSSDEAAPAVPSKNPRALRRSRRAPPSPPPKTTPQEKRRQHADAQDRYQGAATDGTVRLLLRSPTYTLLRVPTRLRFTRSEEDTILAAERRRVVDADYRERCRKKKFIEKFGRRAFANQYLPLHDIYGPHITGHKFNWPQEDPKSPRRPRSPKKARAAAKEGAA
ncbi:hypothetical protein C8R43DRAFT_1117410 [Mycena crocata]|nr:hypothetical protein C8R43DRAFT_1117410 [Mycena crocata]